LAKSIVRKEQALELKDREVYEVYLLFFSKSVATGGKSVPFMKDQLHLNGIQSVRIEAFLDKMKLYT